jgi:hypothetical protein
MSVQTMSRTAVDRYLKLLRLPADAIAGVLRPRDSRVGETTAVELTLDRVEAAVREAVGRVLHDTQLQDDARRRRAAADERQRALTLRGEAERESRQADEQLMARQDAADQRRRAAAQREEEDKETAQKRHDQTRRRLAEGEQRGRSVVQAQKEQATDAIEDSARHSRLEQLSTEARALDEEEEALTARAEAQRLRRAASETKAKRKAGGSD